MRIEDGFAEVAWSNIDTSQLECGFVRGEREGVAIATRDEIDFSGCLPLIDLEPQREIAIGFGGASCHGGIVWRVS